MEKTCIISITKDNQNKMNAIEEAPATTATIQFFQGREHGNRIPATPAHLCSVTPKNTQLPLLGLKCSSLL